MCFLWLYFSLANSMYRRVAKGEEGRTPPLPDLKKLICLEHKICPFLCYSLNYRPEKFFISSFLFRKTVPQHNFWFQKVTQLVSQAFEQLIQRRRLTNKLYLSYINWLDLTPPPLLVFPVTSLSTFPHRI